MKTWIFSLGIALLSACAVEPVTSSSSTTETTSSEDLTLSPGDVQPLAVCTPGSRQLCCPFPQGCSCRGLQQCSDSGVWGICEDATPKGQICL